MRNIKNTFNLKYKYIDYIYTSPNPSKVCARLAVRMANHIFDLLIEPICRHNAIETYMLR